MAVQIQLRRGTEAQWNASNPILAVGEVGLETDTKRFKIGDGSADWDSLGYSSLPENAVTPDTLVDTLLPQLFLLMGA
jgi:hypothetical protein